MRSFLCALMLLVAPACFAGGVNNGGADLTTTTNYFQLPNTFTGKVTIVDCIDGPSQVLDIGDGSAGSVVNIHSDGSGYPRLFFYQDPQTKAEIQYHNAESSMRFDIMNGASYFSFFGGNLGINVAAPSEKLEVGGNAKIDGNLTVTGTVSILLPMTMNFTLLPTNVLPWATASAGPFDYDITLTKAFAQVTLGSGTALVHVVELTTNTQTIAATNNSIGATTGGLYDSVWGDSVLVAGNVLQVRLDSTGYEATASNINVKVDGTYRYVAP